MTVAHPASRWSEWCRLAKPTRRVVLVGLAIVSVIALTTVLVRPDLTPIERSLVGRWMTEHGDLDTRIDLGEDRRVIVEQHARLLLPQGSRGVLTRTTGRWKVEHGRLIVITRPDDAPASLVRRLRTLIREQRWRGRGTLERTWRLEELEVRRFAFTDAATGRRGHAIRAEALVVSADSPPEGETLAMLDGVSARE